MTSTKRRYWTMANPDTPWSGYDYGGDALLPDARKRA